MPTLNFDLNVDKHNKPTLVIECPACKREIPRHLTALTPDSVVACECGTAISLTARDLDRARQLYQDTLRSDGSA